LRRGVGRRRIVHPKFAIVKVAGGDAAQRQLRGRNRHRDDPYRGGDLAQDGRAASITLGGRSHSVPSVLYLREDGTMLVGEAAGQRGIVDT
jgi:hypothetical protein